MCPRLHLCPRQIINYTVSEKSATSGVKNESVKLNITNCLNGWKQSRSQDFATGGGGLFLKFDSTVNELDPNFHLVSIGLKQIQSVFLPKSSDLQKKKSSPKFRAFLCQLISTSISHFTIFGGYFRLGAGYFPF